MNMSESPSLRWVTRMAILGVVAVATMYFWPTDISRVEKNTRNMLRSLTKTGNESLPVAAVKSLDAVSYLASNVVIKLGEPFPASLKKSDLAPLIQQARMRVSTLRIKNLGHQAEKKTDGTIWMDMTLDVEVDASGTSDQLLGNYRLVWRKIDDDWKVTRAEVIEVIKHPSGSMYPL